MPTSERTSFRIGDMGCLVVSDGSLTAPAGFLFTDAPAADLAAALDDNDLEPEGIAAGLNGLVIHAGDRLVLWDVGTGGRWHGGLGRLLPTLREAGVDPDRIDLVVLSHGHPDHIGGLTDAAGGLVFGRARYLMSSREWAFWTDESSLAGVEAAWADVARITLPAIADRLELINGEREIVPGIRALQTPGHTPGHLGLVVESGADRLLCVGDAVGHPLHFAHPEWSVATDMDPDLTLQSRLRLRDLALEESTLVFGNHFVFPGLGTLENDGAGVCWSPRRLATAGR